MISGKAVKNHNWSKKKLFTEIEKLDYKMLKLSITIAYHVDNTVLHFETTFWLSSQTILSCGMIFLISKNNGKICISVSVLQKSFLGANRSLSINYWSAQKVVKSKKMSFFNDWS